MAGSQKPSVLIIGGLGFVGRHLALYIHDNKLASEVRIVDKLLPQLAWLAPEFSEACSQDKFVQADASREQSFPRIFDRPNGGQFDYVIDCGGETRFSESDDVYRIRTYAPSLAIGKECARRGIRVLIQCSTATVYKPDSKPHKETDKAKPSFKISKWKLTLEEDLKKIPGLNLCILRFPRIYGEYDTGFLTPAICLGRVHKELEKPMTFLYSKDQVMNTVYVKDAVRALWTAAEWRATKGPVANNEDPPFPITFNIVDHNNTKKGDLANALTKTFGIECEFLGTLMTQFAKLNQDEIVDEMNEESLETWSDLLNAKGIARPGPISPFLDRELLRDVDLSVDGSLFEQTTGFTYQTPTLPENWLETIIRSYDRMNWWP
ncbi:conserved hypothetical protein [Uncinocarpus reesii 1704]|uniref:NAD-dependent epimerase/dehydratase domain-containing protein n=1 Tax=Uncinocarpus reesii (strain UAMH 1704) TaxID=336963 RepID=C4JVV8_UNCRE|nr:uncharacterized protein UREG_06700 [Uncinocarpus reesii 1704]EEP81835.1 conserved hypothetical protein [Uncinocarpus reesii 1704]